jgi:tetratricopeptide (TPR) repeat protein
MPKQLPPEQERRRMFNGLVEFTARAARKQPLLLIIEDLHWADESTLLHLQHIAQRLYEMPVLVIGTYRDTELDVARSFANALEELLRQRLAHDLLLKRLPQEDVESMLRSRSGQEPPSRLVNLIFNETEGNPFFVEEVVNHLVEEEKLFDSEGQWRRDVRMEEWEVPRNVLLVIGRRLERVSEECRRILSRAAVIGRGVSFKLLNEVIELDEDALFDALEEAERAQLIRSKKPNGEVQLTFVHELIRQTLLNDLSLARRQRLHLRVAEAVEQLYAEALKDHAADLAYHFYQAGGDTEKIIGYSVMAAERATAQTAYEEAVSQYERALRLFEQQQPIDEVRHCDLMLGLGDAYANVGNRSKSEQTFLNVIDIARKVSEPERFAEAVLGLNRFYRITSILDDRVVGLLEEGLELLPEEDSACRAAIMGCLSLFLGGVGLDERRFALSDQAVEMARRVGDPKALFYAAFSRAFIRWGNCPLEERIAYATELAEIGMELANPEGADWGLAYRCSFYLEQGNISASDADLALLKSRGKETSSIFNMWIARHTDATRALMSGRFDEAEQLAVDAFSIVQGVQGNAERQMLVFIFALRWLQGRLGEIEVELESEVEQKYSEDFGFNALYAHMKAALGKKEEARAVLERLAVNDFTDVPRYWGTMNILVGFSQAAIVAGDTNRAAQLYDLLHPYKDHLCIVGTSAACHGVMSLWLGILAAMLKRWDDAVEHFEAALETTVRIGMWPWLARTQHEYARMLIERNESGDIKKSKALLTEAIATYRELGMPTFLEDAEQLMGKL